MSEEDVQAFFFVRSWEHCSLGFVSLSYVRCWFPKQMR